MKTTSLLKVLTLTALLLFSACTSGGGDGDGSSGASRGLDTEACDVLGLTRIINGTPCNESGSPIVRITIVDSQGNPSLCSGAMITNDDVLTAAHCFIGDTSAAVVESGLQASAATAVVIHPGVGVQEGILALFNDAAILRLETPLNLPTLPIVVSREAQPGDIISIFGYGLDENEELGVLRSGEMEVSQVTPNHIFAPFNGRGSNTCNGDSGGPAILSFVDEAGVSQQGIVGVVSTGNLESCREGDTSLFANVQNSAILDFVSAQVPEVGGI